MAKMAEFIRELYGLPRQPTSPEMDELRALRELREVCGMFCEQLPIEVREALHAIPEIEKVHQCSFKGKAGA